MHNAHISPTSFNSFDEKIMRIEVNLDFHDTDLPLTLAFVKNMKNPSTKRQSSATVFRLTAT